MVRSSVLFFLLVCICIFKPNSLLAEQTTTTMKVTDKSHHTPNGFRNPFPGFEERSFGDFLKWVFGERRKALEENSHAPHTFEVIPNDGSFLRSNHSSFTVTWVGHSTLLIQMEGINILTDPIWSERCSIVQFAGPKRYTPPGIAFENLP